MNTSRKQAFEALFDRLGNAAAWQTKGRKLKLWKDVSKQPALFLVRKDLDGKSLPGSDRARVANYFAYIFVRDTGDDGPGGLLDDLVDVVEVALSPDPGDGRQTLDGLVRDCRISGMIETDEGTLGEQAVAWIPITIFID